MHHTFYSNRSYLSYSFQPYETSLILNFRSVLSLHNIGLVYRDLQSVLYLYIFFICTVKVKRISPNLGDSTMGFLAIAPGLVFLRPMISTNSAKIH